MSEPVPIVRSHHWHSPSQGIGELEWKKSSRCKVPAGHLWGRLVAADKLFLFAKNGVVSYLDLESQAVIPTEFRFDYGATSSFGPYVSFPTVDGVQGVTIVDATDLSSRWLPQVWGQGDPIVFEPSSLRVVSRSSKVDLSTGATEDLGLTLVLGSVCDNDYYGEMRSSSGESRSGCYDLNASVLKWSSDGIKSAHAPASGGLFVLLWKEKVATVAHCDIDGKTSRWSTTMPDHISELVLYPTRLLAIGAYDAWILDPSDGSILGQFRRSLSNTLLTKCGKAVFENSDNELVTHNLETLERSTKLKLPKAKHSELSTWKGKILRRSGTLVHCIE